MARWFSQRCRLFDGYTDESLSLKGKTNLSENVAVWVPLIAAVAGWIAAGIAAYSAFLARRSTRIMSAQESRKHPCLVPYLSHGYMKRRPDKNARVYTFSISLNNISDSDNSVVEISLIMRYRRQDLHLYTAVLPHNPSLVTDLTYTNIQPFQLPATIPAHQSITGWALFVLSDDIVNNAIIDSYTIRSLDTHGLAFELESIILKLVPHDFAVINHSKSFSSSALI